MTFTGFPAEAFDFYVRLGMDNSRPFWQANKSVYDTQVKAPLLAALEELEAYGPFQIFRPYRDVRFAKDKTPYKENAGAYGEGEGGTGYYLALNATSLFAGAGYYGFAADQMERFRTAVDADPTGGDLAARVAAMEKKGFTVGAISELKTAPRGYPKDHPRIALLRRKGLAVEDAVVRTAAQRVRPVLLTTVTTILGLLPMVFEINVDFAAGTITRGSTTSDWWVLLASAVVYGLAFSTVLTLALTPVMLAAPTVLRRRWFGRKKGGETSLGAKQPASTAADRPQAAE